MQQLSQFYAHRIVNVNVNIVLAGLLALIPTAAAAHAAEHYLGITHGGAIAGITFAVDATSDIAVYYLLHWVANHMPRNNVLRPVSAAYGHLPYFKDATLAQFQRMCISPLLYAVALGGQYLLTRQAGVPVLWATVAGFSAGILSSRVLHTWWMLRQERLAQAAHGKTAQGQSSSPAPH